MACLKTGIFLSNARLKGLTQDRRCFVVIFSTSCSKNIGLCCCCFNVFDPKFARCRDQDIKCK